MKKICMIAMVVMITVSSALFADIRLPALIGDNMVVQQDTAVNLWGWARPGERVSIRPGWISGQPVSTVADENGRWKTTVRSPRAGGPYTLEINGDNQIELKNVLVGEVWICSGQSNMEMPMQGWDKQPIMGGPEDIAQAANASIRLFIVEKAVADTPQEDVKGQWLECTPETVKNFSAVGYYFTRKINQETQVPVGMINSSWGGTLAEAWTRSDFLAYDDNLSRIIDGYEQKYAAWQEACRQAEKDSQPKPQPLQFGRILPHDKPAALYNAMIAPLTGMTIRGAIWYQGESNAGNGYQYRDLFPTMIRNWRCDFSNYEMPFYFVQLASYTDHKPGTRVEPYRGEPSNSGWAEVREAQLMTSSLRNTGMAVTIDIGESNNIHPGNKRDVGERLARWALAKDYGKTIDYSGPLYAGYWIEGDKIRIAFHHADGLTFKDGEAKGFALAGKDKKFIWADARIDGTTVLVYSDQIKEPVAVRYAWGMDPEHCLYNKAGLPASPFRTDDWKTTAP